LLASAGIETMATHDRDEAQRWLDPAKVPPALRG
jgi:hypothetical protein